MDIIIIYFGFYFIDEFGKIYIWEFGKWEFVL